MVAEPEPKLETQFTPECPGQDNAQGTTTAPGMQYIYLVVVVGFLLIAFYADSHPQKSRLQFPNGRHHTLHQLWMSPEPQCSDILMLDCQKTFSVA